MGGGQGGGTDIDFCECYSCMYRQDTVEGPKSSSVACPGKYLHETKKFSPNNFEMPSPVWSYFKKIANGKKVRCNNCKVELAFLTATSNMLTHLEKKHNIVLPKLASKGGKRRPALAPSALHENEEEKEDDPMSPTNGRNIQNERGTSGGVAAGSEYAGPLTKCLNNMNSFSAGGARDAECTNALLYMIAADAMPLRTPERKGFRAFCKILQPLYQIPHENTTTKRLEEKYYILRERVGLVLSEAQHITLTADIWTHKSTMRSYLGVTAHFRRGNRQKTVELGARPLDERKTIANLRTALRNFCMDWQIQYDRIRGVVTDGGSNIKGAVKEEFGEEKHISCIAHKINIIGQKVIGLHEPAAVPSERRQPLPDVPERESDIEDENDEDPAESAQSDGDERELLKRLIRKVKKIVRFFRQSEVATSMLKASQTGESNLKLIQEVRTRFNSCFDMINRYIQLNRCVTGVLLYLQRDRTTKTKPPAILTGDEEEALVEVKDLLSPLSAVTVEVSSEKNVTISKCIPLIKNLKAAIEVCMTSTPIGHNLKVDLLRQIKVQFGQIENIKMFAAATLLDPRYKKVGFTSDERKPIVIANAMAFVSDLVKTIMRENRDRTAEVVSVDTDTGTFRTGGAGVRGGGLWERFDHEVESHIKDFCGQDVAGGIPVQLRTFLDSPPVSRHGNPDPMVAWAALKGEYTYVFPIAEQFLSLLASSIPWERLFSHAGLIASDLRSRLTGKHVEMLVFLRSCDESLWFS